jgi:DNA-3-methyladenine glycosylase II
MRLNAKKSSMPLTEREIRLGVRALSRRDSDLARISKEIGPPPLWAREPGFPTLVHIILEQQVSLASARAAFDRLRAAGRLTPRRFLEFNDAELKTIGFSRQKAAYVRELSLAVIERRLDLDGLSEMSDLEARESLLAMKGIGPWTADIYLLMALRRPDIWPSGDLALAVAAQEVKKLPGRPTPEELDQLGATWRPWRAVAARLLWHHYLTRRA